MKPLLKRYAITGALTCMQDITCSDAVQSDLLELVTSLGTAKGVLELQQGGDRLVKKLKEVREEQWANVQSKIDMLKQESQAAIQKVRLPLQSAWKYGSSIWRKGVKNF